MFLTPSQQTCATCQQPIVEGQKIVLTHSGTVEKIGGLGQFKDALTIRAMIIKAQHGTCAFPVK